jgi:hypothetical protein
MFEECGWLVESGEPLIDPPRFDGIFPILPGVFLNLSGAVSQRDFGWRNLDFHGSLLVGVFHDGHYIVTIWDCKSDEKLFTRVFGVWLYSHGLEFQIQLHSFFRWNWVSVSGVRLDAKQYRNEIQVLKECEDILTLFNTI